VLCNLFGHDMENGLLPASDELAGPMIRNICYQNVKQYLGLDVP
jgi:glucuronate isomerase